MWALGSSTSQSKKVTLCPLDKERAKFVATRVFPVPPLPLATEIITLLYPVFYYIGGRLQTPLLQVGQLVSEDSFLLEP